MKKTVLILFLISNLTQVFSQFIDENTPENILPANSNVGVKWKLEFSDEFNGTDVNTTKWNIDNSTRSRAARPSIGITDWRWKPENVSLENGNLVLKVYKTGSNSMTNGSLNSYNKYHAQYGYFEARIKIGDASKGTHTAFWLQGPNMGNVDGTANDGAEIDIFESAWTGEFTKSVVHIDGYGAHHQANTKRYETPGIHSGFHTWGFHWTEYFMDIYYNGVRKVRYSDPKWVVKSPEFLWLSNGASFGLTGDQYFIDLPIGYLTETHVDYIRVWKDASEQADSLLDKSKWSLIMVDSEDNFGSNLATNAFDGNPFTFWHTEWNENQPAHPHEIQIDLGDIAKIIGFNYLPRQDNNPNGNIAGYQFYASNDINSWGSPLKTGTFSSTGEEVTVLLDNPVEFRYIRLVALSEINGLKFTNVGELSIIGNYKENGGANSIINTTKNNSELFSIYPNPSTGKELNILFNSEKLTVGDISIFTLLGKVVKKVRIEQERGSISFQEKLNPGVYLVHIKGENGYSETQKMLVK